MIKSKFTKKVLIFTVFTLGCVNIAMAEVPSRMDTISLLPKEGKVPPPPPVNGDVAPPPPPPKEGKVPPPPPANGDVAPPPRR